MIPGCDLCAFCFWKMTSLNIMGDVHCREYLDICLPPLYLPKHSVIKHHNNTHVASLKSYFSFLFPDQKRLSLNGCLEGLLILDCKSNLICFANITFWIIGNNFVSGLTGWDT